MKPAYGNRARDRATKMKAHPEDLRRREAERLGNCNLMERFYRDPAAWAAEMHARC
jgi:hypothetical protein